MTETLTAAPSAEADAERPWRDFLLTPNALIAFAVGARVVLLVWLFSEGFENWHSGLVASDINRYRDIAQGAGVPYRDFAVEYPPVTWLLLWLTGQASLLITYFVVILSQLVCELVAVRYVGKLTGRRGAAYLLVLNTPLVMLLYRRVDLLTVALVAAGLYHTLRGSQRAGGVLLGLSVLGKLWPIVILPLLDLRRHATAVMWAGGTIALLVAAWLLAAGVDGPLQVLTFRGATGWQVESLLGNWYLLFTEAPVEWQSGAHRIGVAAAWVRAALMAAVAAGVLVLAWLAWRRDTVAVLPAAAAAVLLFLCLAPLLSPQFMGWVTLVTALAAATVQEASRRQALLITCFLACLATVIVYPPLFDVLLARWRTPLAFLTVRNVLLCTLLVLFVARLREMRATPAGEEAVEHAPEAVVTT